MCQLSKQMNSFLYETIGHNNHLTMSESNEILHLKARDMHLLYIFVALELDN